MKKDKLPPELQRLVDRELMSGEDLLWVGQPVKKHLPKSTDLIFQIGGGIIGIALSILVLVFFVAQSFPLAIIGGTIGLAGIIFALTYAWVRYHQPKNITYIVTDMRIIIIEDNTVRSYRTSDIEELERINHDDGTGDIIFNVEQEQQTSVVGGIPMNTINIEKQGLYGVQYPDRLEALMIDRFLTIYDDDATLPMKPTDIDKYEKFLDDLNSRSLSDG